jgi:hypothetical protein
VHWTRGNIHTNGAHKNNDNNTMLMFIGLKKTAQKQTPQEENDARKDKEFCSQKRYFNVSNENVRTLKYFGLKTSAM